MAKEIIRQEENALRGNNMVPKANCLSEIRNRSAKSTTFRDVSPAFEWTNISVDMVHHLLRQELSFGTSYRDCVHVQLQLLRWHTWLFLITNF